MYKLLIVDDEQIVIDSMTHIIKSNFGDQIEIVTAKSGVTAIEKAIQFHPDIVFMDINIPGIKGLEVIKEIQNFLKNIVYYVISAYEQFSFAKEAIQLGVTDYILKPLNKAKLIEITQSAIDKIESNKTKRNENLKLKEKAELLFPILESNLIYNIMFKRKFIYERENYFNLLNFHIQEGFILILNFLNKENIDDFREKLISIHLRLKSKIDSSKCVYGPLIDGKIVIFVSEKKKETVVFDQIMAVKFAEKIKDYLEKLTEINFIIGVGSSREVKDLTISYEEANKAVLLGREIINYYSETELMNIEIIDIHKYAHQLVEKISGENFEEYYFEEAFEYLLKESHGDIGNLKSFLIKLLINLENIIQEKSKGSYDLVNFINTDDINQLMLFSDETELRSFFMAKKNFLREKSAATLKYNYSTYVKQTLDYIYSNYQKEISLDEISAGLFISPQYLSKLFKEETGNNFIDFLIGIRIKNAKELLKNTNKTIKEIAYEIGYSDPNYFSRIFRKEIKLTPKEFRNSNKN